MPDNSVFAFARPTNEPVFSYAAGSEEKRQIKDKLVEFRSKVIEIPLLVGGKEIRTGNMGEIRIPHNHRHVIARYHKAGKKEVDMAIAAAMEAKKRWEKMQWDRRAAIFKKAAALIAGPYRADINAATMLGQGKNIYQSEIDAVCELVDFLEFNAYFLGEIYKEQPDSSRDIINQMEYRALEGFVFAVSPFNFTAIGGNLPAAPAMAGNTVVWKPASTAVYSNYLIMKILQEAGLPAGVINFIPGQGAQIGDYVLESPDLAGVHFTGSTEVFRSMWKKVGGNIDKYKTYPRLVGETGGKDFVMAHSSAEKDELVTALVRGAFEYQGQKCSAASRAYIPAGKWEEIKETLQNTVENLAMGPVEDFTNFINAVIDRASFEKITEYIKYAKASPEAEIIAGGNWDDAEGYFIRPTVIKTGNPKFQTMQEEIFGPVLTIYVYPDDGYDDALALCNETSPYALTGCVIARDKSAQQKALETLTHAAGNFYINDKPTAAVVGQQPFGGSRASGTNDKAGSIWNLIRWISPRALKETLNPPRDYRYPFMEEK
ncbi:MAG: L-glutamate gamma-semialdehyde dehydrogenase [Dethiobacter sp.]|jgi:1-pyrroline-5-carboxylate dehydrogenase|nr:L-glutamate gamma-semialdehyde dehydrogenase [Dethiobacter sp.]